MNILQSEIARLYRATAPSNEPNSRKAGTEALVRCAILELARPADWTALGAVWHGVQADLELPAPAIAINGTDGYQLWFSWQQDLPAPEAQRFLQQLCQHYLSGITAARIRVLVGADALVPVPHQVKPEQWSAFIAPDLAIVFADEPWLDRDPGLEAQTQLLARLESMRAQDFARAFQTLTPPPPSLPAMREEDTSGPVAAHNVQSHYATETPAAFLESVMKDPSAPLALRVQAATALLGK